MPLHRYIDGLHRDNTGLYPRYIIRLHRGISVQVRSRRSDLVLHYDIPRFLQEWVGFEDKGNLVEGSGEDPNHVLLDLGIDGG